jgi:hypothetical protein
MKSIRQAADCLFIRVTSNVGGSMMGGKRQLDWQLDIVTNW